MVSIIFDPESSVKAEGKMYDNVDGVVISASKSLTLVLVANGQTLTGGACTEFFITLDILFLLTIMTKLRKNLNLLLPKY